jgi:hypothetical protein
MLPFRLMLSGVTRANRFEVTAAIDDAVAASGGWIDGHTLLSNIATIFRFVVPAGQLHRLMERMAEAHVTMDPESLALVAAATGRPPETEQAGSIAVTFIHDEPDLRRDVPAVPG